MRGRAELILPVHGHDRDLEGRPCTLLADALGVSGAGLTWATDHYYPSAVASGWAAPWPETRVGWFQALEHERGDAVLHDGDELALIPPVSGG